MGDFMVVVEDNQIELGQLKQELKLLEEHELALYHLVSLYECLSSHCGKDDCEFGNAIVKQVIKDMEDAYFSSFYKTEDTLSELIESLFWKYYSLCRKYKNSEEAMCLINEFHFSYKEIFDEAIVKYRNVKKSDFVGSLLFHSTNWLTEFFISDIPIDIRVEMLCDSLKSLINQKSFHYIYPVLKLEACDTAGIDSTIINQKKDELLQAFVDGKDNLYFLFMLLLENDCYGVINLLQDNVFDFNQFYWNYNSADSVFHGAMISTVGAMCCDFNHNRLSDFKKLYKSDSYLKVDDTARYYNDLMILEYLREEDLAAFISLENFPLCVDRINKLARRVLDKQIEMDRADNGFRNIIKSILIRKVRNCKGKSDIDYVTMFMEKSFFKKDKEKPFSQKKIGSGMFS